MNGRKQEHVRKWKNIRDKSNENVLWMKMLFTQEKQIMIHTQIALVEIHTAVRWATRTTLAAIFSQARLCFSPSLHLCPVFRQSPFGDVSTSRLWALSIRSVSLVHFVMHRSSPAARRLSDHLFRPWHQLFRVSHHHHLDHLHSRYDQRGECNPCVTCCNAAPSPRMR